MRKTSIRGFGVGLVALAIAAWPAITSAQVSGGASSGSSGAPSIGSGTSGTGSNSSGLSGSATGSDDGGSAGARTDGGALSGSMGSDSGSDSSGLSGTARTGSDALSGQAKGSAASDSDAQGAKIDRSEGPAAFEAGAEPNEDSQGGTAHGSAELENEDGGDAGASLQGGASMEEEESE